MVNRVNPVRPAEQPSGESGVPRQRAANPAGFAASPEAAASPVTDAHSISPASPASAVTGAMVAVVPPRTGDSSLGWTWARARDVVWTLLGVFGLVYAAAFVLKLFTHGILMFVLSAVLAFIVRPAVTRLERHLSLPQTAAALIVYLFLVVLLSSLGAWGVAQLSAQLTAALNSLPEYYQTLQERIPALEANARAIGISVDVKAVQAEIGTDIPRAGLAWQGLAWVSALGGTAVNTFLVLVISFYLVIDGERLLEALLAITPAGWKPYLLFAESTLLRMVGGYLRGQLTMGAIVGVTVLALCLLLGVRYSLVLAVLAFFCELMPMVGPILMGTTMTLVGLVDSLRLALLGGSVYIALRTLVVYVLGPRIVSHAVGLHPIATILGLVVGAKLFGVWGVLFAAPVLGFSFVIMAAVYRQLRGLDPRQALASGRQVRPRFRQAVPVSAREEYAATIN